MPTDAKTESAAEKAGTPTAKNPIPVPDHDRVVMASRKADGTPDQTPDFEYIGDYEFAEAAAKEQMAQQAVSAADVAIRGVTEAELAESMGSEGGTATGKGEPDAVVGPIVEAHKAAAEAAEAAAVADVKEHHKGLGDTAPRTAGERRARGVRR